MVSLVPLPASIVSSTEHLQVQSMTVPEAYLMRISLYGRVDGEELYQPTLADFAKGVLLLQEAGVPEDAEITVQKWNAPANRLYVTAEWRDDGG